MSSPPSQDIFKRIACHMPNGETEGGTVKSFGTDGAKISMSKLAVYTVNA
jgi:hypothetical protein